MVIRNWPISFVIALALATSVSKVANAQDAQGQIVWQIIQADCAPLEGGSSPSTSHPVELLLGANLSARDRCLVSRAFFTGMLKESSYGVEINHSMFPSESEYFGKLLDDFFALVTEGGTPEEPEGLKRLVRIINNSRARVLGDFLLMNEAAFQCVVRNLIRGMPPPFGHQLSSENWAVSNVSPAELGPECPDLRILAAYHGDEGESFVDALTVEDMNDLLGKMRRLANLMRCEYPEYITLAKPSPNCPEGMSTDYNFDASQAFCVPNPDDITVSYPVCQRFVTHQ